MGNRFINYVYVIHRRMNHRLEIVALRPQHQVPRFFRFPLSADLLIYREIGITVYPRRREPLPLPGNPNTRMTI